jgi:hypothetical protein
MKSKLFLTRVKTALLFSGSTLFFFGSSLPAAERLDSYQVVEPARVADLQNTAAESDVLADLLEAIEAAKDQYRAPDPARLKNAQATLISKLDQVDAMLEQVDLQTKKSWSDYLDLPGLRAIATGERPFSARPINAAIRNLTVDAPGIERAELIELRSALTEFRNASVYDTFPKLDEFYSRTLARLATTVESQIATPSVESAARIGQTAGILEDANLAPELQAAIRKAVGFHNSRIEVSERLACALAASNPIDNTSDIAEEILGTLQTGVARTRGTLTVDFQPNASMAEILVSLDGITDSQVTGSQSVPVFGEITVEGEGKTRIHGDTFVFLDGNGASHSLSQSTAETTTRINSVCSPAIIRQIVKREIHKQADKGDYIATQKAKEKIRENMDQQVMEGLAKANKQLEEKLLLPLLRTDRIPQEMSFATTEDALIISLLRYGRYQAAADSAAPVVKQRGDLVVQVHESVFVNFMDNLLGRQSFSSEQLAEIQRNAGKKVQETNEFGKKLNPWKVNFANAQPVVVRFRDQQLVTRIEIKNIEESGMIVVERKLFITSIYDIVDDEKGLRLVQQGLAQLEYEGDPTLRELGIKGNLDDPIQAAFPAEIPVKNIQLPETAPVKGNVSIVKLDADGGWLTVVADFEPVR